MKKVSRDDMIFNSFNFDFFDTQRLEFNQIIVVILRTNVELFSNSFNLFNSSNNKNNVDNNNNDNNEK